MAVRERIWDIKNKQETVRAEKEAARAAKAAQSEEAAETARAAKSEEAAKDKEVASDYMNSMLDQETGERVTREVFRERLKQRTQDRLKDTKETADGVIPTAPQTPDISMVSGPASSAMVDMKLPIMSMVTQSQEYALGSEPQSMQPGSLSPNRVDVAPSEEQQVKIWEEENRTPQVNERPVPENEDGEGVINIKDYLVTMIELTKKIADREGLTIIPIGLA